MLTRLSTMAPQNAALKLSTWNPGTIADASSSMRALITNQKMPSVSSVKGKVMIFKKAPSVALIKPIARAAINAANGPLTWNPGMSRATTHTPSALKTQLRRCLIAFSEMQAEYKRPLRCAQLCGISQAWRFGCIVFLNWEYVAGIRLGAPPGLDRGDRGPPVSRQTWPAVYNQEFAYYERRSPRTHHREHRAGQRKDHGCDGHGVAGSRARDARAHAAIFERIVALRRTRRGPGVRRQICHEADGPRLREGRH